MTVIVEDIILFLLIIITNVWNYWISKFDFFFSLFRSYTFWIRVWKASSTPWPLLADVSKRGNPYLSANAWASSLVTTLLPSNTKSILLAIIIKGKVFDVAVDLRRNSSTYGKWVGVELSEENKKMFYIPPYFAHGFLVLSDEAEFTYKCTDVYNHNAESGIMYNDPEIGIEWPEVDCEILTSEKDGKWQTLKEFTEGEIWK